MLRRCLSRLIELHMRGIAIKLPGVLLALATVAAWSPLWAQKEFPVIDRFDVVTDQAAPGDGGNAWGGHPCRIVRTRFGVSTAYMAEVVYPSGKGREVIYFRLRLTGTAGAATNQDSQP